MICDDYSVYTGRKFEVFKTMNIVPYYHWHKNDRACKSVFIINTTKTTEKLISEIHSINHVHEVNNLLLLTEIKHIKFKIIIYFYDACFIYCFSVTLQEV